MKPLIIPFLIFLFLAILPLTTNIHNIQPDMITYVEMNFNPDTASIGESVNARGDMYFQTLYYPYVAKLEMEFEYYKFTKPVYISGNVGDNVIFIKKYYDDHGWVWHYNSGYIWYIFNLHLYLKVKTSGTQLGYNKGWTGTRDVNIAMWGWWASARLHAVS